MKTQTEIQTHYGTYLVCGWIIDVLLFEYIDVQWIAQLHTLLMVNLPNSGRYPTLWSRDRERESQQSTMREYSKRLQNQILLVDTSCFQVECHLEIHNLKLLKRIA